MCRESDLLSVRNDTQSINRWTDYHEELAGIATPMQSFLTALHVRDMSICLVGKFSLAEWTVGASR